MEFILKVFALKIPIISLLLAFTFLLFLFVSKFLLLLELLFTFPLIYVFLLVPARTSNPTSAPFVSEALFCLHRGTNIITLLGCDRISGHVPRLIISFFSFFVDSYFAGARETQEDTL